MTIELDKPALTGEDYRVLKELGEAHKSIRAELSRRIIGQDEVVEQVLTAFFAGGHVLLLGVPGLGKTLLIRSLAEILGLKFNRIQFTPDLMPSDITGSDVLASEGNERTFKFLGGPIFTNFVLADEINRTPPKTQAAMLEAMEEFSVTVAGKSYPLPRPFFVMATQNPIEQEGTYILPAAALDRFLFTVIVDYPNQLDELNMLFETTSKFEQRVARVLDEDKVKRMLDVVRRINMRDETLKYAVELVRATRPAESHDEMIKDMVECGGSPRATQALILGAKARAALEGRDEATPRDIRAIAMPALHHRILTNFHADADNVTSRDIVRKLIRQVPRPQGDEVVKDDFVPFDLIGVVRYWLIGGPEPAHWANKGSRDRRSIATTLPDGAAPPQFIVFGLAVGMVFGLGAVIRFFLALNFAARASARAGAEAAAAVGIVSAATSALILGLAITSALLCIRRKVAGVFVGLCLPVLAAVGAVYAIVREEGVDSEAQLLYAAGGLLSCALIGLGVFDLVRHFKHKMLLKNESGSQGLSLAAASSSSSGA